MAKAVPVRVRPSAPSLVRAAQSRRFLASATGGIAISGVSEMTPSQNRFTPYLAQVNELRDVDGVWSLAGAVGDLAYSDGSATEQALKNLLGSANDLTWRSREFESHFGDWALRYHLSPLRANILRGLALKPESRVLEVGAGCGAITRFLGDEGHHVDAVEGSHVRAQIARLRCSALPQVHIVHCDYHALTLPAQGYDLILFVGVLEYARRFGDTSLSAREAVKMMLKKALEALAPGGIIVVAIENRLGAKYLFGGPEDHLARPWAGISRYPVATDDPGIATFSAKEWTDLLDSLGVSHAFYYPLPDYKLPEAILSDSGLGRQGAGSLLWRYGSEHRGSAESGQTPTRLQATALYDEGLVGSFADSFGIVLGHQEQTASDRISHPWVVFDAPDSDGFFGLTLDRSRDCVRNFREPHGSERDCPRGEPLFKFWLRALAGLDNFAEFARMAAKHAEQVCEQGRSQDPAALLVGDDGNVAPERFPWADFSGRSAADNPSFWLSRALHAFWKLVKDDIQSLSGFRDCADEEAFEARVRRALSSSASSGRVTQAAIYWASGPQPAFVEARRLSAPSSIRGRHHLVFTTKSPLHDAQWLRFDPSDHAVAEEGETAILKSFRVLTSAKQVAIDVLEAIREDKVQGLNQLQLSNTTEGVALTILGDDPWLVVDLAMLGPQAEFDWDQVEIDIDWGSDK